MSVITAADHLSKEQKQKESQVLSTYLRFVLIGLLLNWIGIIVCFVGKISIE